jgi:hemoglobin/transferrin/lactoferrin receptor protein
MPIPLPAMRCIAAALACAFTLPAFADTAPDTVIITGQRPDKPGSVTVLDADDLARQGATDMQNMARYAPLISVPGAASGSGNVWDGAGNTGFNIRGVEGNRVSLALDGIALPDAATKPDASTLNSFAGGRDYFDPETFRSVTIASGTSAAGAGVPGLGGSVAFVTRAPEDYVNDTRATYADYKFGYDGAAGMRMHALTGAARSGAFKMLAVLVHRDGAALESAGSAPVNPDEWHADALLAKLSWSPFAGHRFTGTIDAYRAEHARDYDNKQGASYPDGSHQASTTRRNRFSIEHQYAGASPWFDSLDSRIYVQDADVDDVTDARYITGNQPYLRHIVTGFANRSIGFTSNAAKRLGPHQLTYGISFEDLDTTRPWNEDRTVLATGAHQITNKDRMADTSTRTLAAFVRTDLAANAWLTISPGVRVTYRDLEPKTTRGYLVALPAAVNELQQRDERYATPSLAFNAALNAHVNAYFQYSRGTRLPSAAELTGTYDSFSYTGTGAGYAVIGNANLKKETSNAFEIGIKAQAVPGLRLHGALFETRYNNFIEYAAQAPDPVNYPTLSFGLYRPENLGKAATWGAEASADLDFGQWAQSLKGTSLTLAGGVQHSRARNLDTGRESELASTLPKKASAILAWDDPARRGGASAAIVRVGAKTAADDIISGVTTARFAVPAATVIDLTGYWNLGRHAVFTVGVYNVGDKQYWDYASARGLAAATSVATRTDIERMARPGRYAAATIKVIF